MNMILLEYVHVPAHIRISLWMNVLFLALEQETSYVYDRGIRRADLAEDIFHKVVCGEGLMLVYGKSGYPVYWLFVDIKRCIYILLLYLCFCICTPSSIVFLCYSPE